jgi:hypothetical protein
MALPNTYVVRIEVDKYGRDNRVVERTVYAPDPLTAASIAGAQVGARPESIHRATVEGPNER